MTTLITGQLEVDHERGVIYFHAIDDHFVEQFSTVSVLRVCKLPTPIPNNEMLDITHMIGASWDKKRLPKAPTMVIEDVVEFDSQDGGKSLVASLYGEGDDNFFVRLQSFDGRKDHRSVRYLDGKKVRVTVEVLPDESEKNSATESKNGT